MTPPSRAVIALVFAAMLAPQTANAQDPSTVRARDLYELVLRDGSRVYGTIQRQTADEVVLMTASGVIVTARAEQVVALKRVRGRVVGGEFQRIDPTSTRLFFGPTARQLKRGEAYLGVYQVLMPSLQVGITDRIALGGGTPLIFFGDGEDGWNRPFWVTPKVQLLDRERLQLAAGVFHGFTGDGDGAGVGYGVLTAGSERASITAGAGVAYSTDGERSPVVMVGGDRQVSRNVKVITENYFWRGGDGYASVGFRFFGEQLSADFGLAVPLGVDDLFVFPVVNFVYSF